MPKAGTPTKVGLKSKENWARTISVIIAMREEVPLSLKDAADIVRSIPWTDSLTPDFPVVICVSKRSSVRLVKGLKEHGVTAVAVG